MTIELPAGHVLTVTADVVSAGTVQRVGGSGSGVYYDPASVASESSVVLGPFSGVRTYDILSDRGALSYARSVPNENLIRSDLAGPVAIQSTTLPSGVAQTIPENTQSVVFGTLTIQGDLTLAGTLIVPSIPSA